MRTFNKWALSPALLQHIAPQLDSLVSETVKRIKHQPFPGPLFLLEDKDNPTYKALRLIVALHFPGIPTYAERPCYLSPDLDATYVTVDATAMYDDDTKPTVRVRGGDWPTAKMPLYCDAEPYPNAIVYPMFDWTRAQVAAYLTVNGVAIGTGA